MHFRKIAESVLERATQVEARAADKLLRRGTYLGALHGVPVGLYRGWDLIRIPSANCGITGY